MKRVFFRPSAVRDLDAFKGRDLELVETAAIAQFAHTGVGDLKMLAGPERHMRLQAGDWRIRFSYENPNSIRILHIRHRREAYH